MEALQALPSITRISKNVVRILGQNPSKFHLQGTNVYLIGQRKPYIIVDTGEGLPEFIPYLEDALQNNGNPFDPEEVDVSDIIITHRHLDHTGGLPTVLAMLRKRWTARHGEDRPYSAPRIHKFPLAHPDSDRVFNSIPAGDFTPSKPGVVTHALYEGQKFHFTLAAGAESTDTDTTLEILHVPGHTPDSIAIFMPADKALYTGDTILGHGSTVFEDLYTFMESLAKMIAFNKGADGKAEPRYTTLYPAHGPTVPHTHVDMYQRHRLEREKQILTVLEKEPPEGDQFWSTMAIVKDIYRDYPPSLCDAAAHSAHQHLRKLAVEGRVAPAGGRGHHLKWEFQG